MYLARKYLPYLAILVLLTSPAIALGFVSDDSRTTASILTSVLVATIAFVLPVSLFFRRLKLYLYALIPVVIVTPALLFSIYYFRVPPGFELIAFSLQTNPREAREAVEPFVVYFILAEALFVILYFYLVRRSATVIPRKAALFLSATSGALLAVVTWHANMLSQKTLRQITKGDLILRYEYPFSILAGAVEVNRFLKKNHLRQAEHFSFKAVKNDTLRERQVYVLVIGESSRYDRWQINGYLRETSPRLNSLDNLIAYKDVVAGAHYTWVSVPQIITRATPDDYDAQYREQSVIKVFQEAGFRTFWLSNQSDQDVFWSGSITLHAKTADYFTFSPTYSPNLDFENIYDERLLPVLDSVLQNDPGNLFLVMHTMGNHWEYSRRYPPSFDTFKPSRMPPNNANLFDREVLINSYDNSILYADYMIYSIIDRVRANAGICSVAFISDHGEDLFDAFGDKPDFHFRPSEATLRIPLFIWTSHSYDRAYPEKRRNLEAHALSPTGAENIFYTIVDMANIRIEGFEPSKSLAHESFTPSLQKYYGDDRNAHPFSSLR